MNCPSSSKQIKISDQIVESTLQEIYNVSDQQQHGTSSGIYVGSNCSNFTINYYSNKWICFMMNSQLIIDSVKNKSFKK